MNHTEYGAMALTHWDAQDKWFEMLAECSGYEEVYLLLIQFYVNVNAHRELSQFERWLVMRLVNDHLECARNLAVLRGQREGAA